MTTPPPAEVTQLLRAWSEGDQAALNQLMPLVYDELRELAKRYMSRERSDHLLQTTALVNEAYLRLIDVHAVQWQNRAHFFALSAQLMRRVLVDFARARNFAQNAPHQLQTRRCGGACFAGRSGGSSPAAGYGFDGAG